MYPTFGALFYPQKYLTNKQAIEELKQGAIYAKNPSSIHPSKYLVILDKPFITGNQITIACLFVCLLHWATPLKLDLTLCTKLPDFIYQVVKIMWMYKPCSLKKLVFLKNTNKNNRRPV